MIRIILPFILLLISLQSFSQEKDTYQADSVMKENRIRTKTRYYENSGSKAKQIYSFDKQGRLIEFVLTSNSNEKETQFSITYQYNEKGALIKEINRTTGEPASKAETKEYTYSLNGDHKAVEYAGKKKSIISETVYEADSAKETTRFIIGGKVRRQHISYYEKPLYTYKFKGFEDTEGEPKVFVVAGKEFRVDQQDTWEYDFENKYDNRGRIVERVRKVKGVIQDKSIYTYTSEGLLSEKLEIRYYNGKELKSKELFSYLRW